MVSMRYAVLRAIVVGIWKTERGDFV